MASRLTIIIYADDLVIISPSAKGLRRLLDICAVYGQTHDILFNDDNTMCMYMPANSSFYINTPDVFLNGRRLYFTVKYKYLGRLMTHDGSDEANMSREMGFYYGRSNGLSKHVNACSRSLHSLEPSVVIFIVGHLWHDFRKSALRQLMYVCMYSLFVQNTCTMKKIHHCVSGTNNKK